MLPYLLKSSICLAVFLLFYKLLLERERMHTFKRYYLLAALTMAFTIPLITFTEYVEVTEPITRTDSSIAGHHKDGIFDPASIKVPDSHFSNSDTRAVETTWSAYWPLLPWMIYFCGTLFFAFKFFRNLRRILGNIRRHAKHRVKDVIYVLLRREIVPHTFFDYIFLNKQRFESDAIPEEVMIHETAHARQKHSLDVLFVELIQLIFWFNPLVHLIKNSIKLNHEFLADRAVLNSGADTPSYQNILLNFASSTKHRANQPLMANALDHSIHSSIRLTLSGKTFHLGRNTGGQVKKRFTVMKAKTSKKSVYLKSLLVAPLLALLLYGFTETNVVYTIIPDKEVPVSTASGNSERDAETSYATDAPDQEGASKKQVREYNRLAKKYNVMLAEKGNIWIKGSEVERMEELYAMMSEEQRSESEPFPDFPEPPAPPEPPMTSVPPSAPYPDAEPNPPIAPMAPVKSREANSEVRREALKRQARALERQARLMEKEARRLEEQAENMERQTTRFRDNQEIEENRRKLSEEDRQLLENRRELMEENRDEMEKLRNELREESMRLRSRTQDSNDEGLNELLKSNENQEVLQRLRSELESNRGLIEEFISKEKSVLQEIISDLSENAVLEDILYNFDRDEILEDLIANQEIYDHLGRSLSIDRLQQLKDIDEYDYDDFWAPEPPTPPAPKSPLELFEELKDQSVRVLVNGEEVDYDAARGLFEEETFQRIDVRKANNERPVLSVWHN